MTALNDNLAVEQVKGIDWVATYQFDMGSMGSMHLHNVLAYIDSWDQQELSSAPKEACEGNWGGVCGYPTPDWRNNLRGTWTTPWNVTASAQWRYISKVDDLNGFRDLDEVSYFDLSAIWDITDWAGVRAGVNNITDEKPPIAGNGAGPSIEGNGNTFPGMYDALGRYWFVGATLTF